MYNPILVGKTKFYYYLGAEQFQPEDLIKHAVLAEKSGFDGLFVSEHFHPWVDDLGSAGFSLSTLGAIAVLTNNIKLMTGVITPLFRFHPAVVAQAAATIDRLSEGRFDLGVGTGENINEGPLGYNFSSYTERSDRMVEALEIIKKLLAGEKVSFQGKYYSTDRARLYSLPHHDLKVWLAAGGEKSVKLALENADGIITSVKDPSDTLEKVIKPAHQQKKDFPVLCSRWCIHARDKKEAIEALKPWRGLRVPNRLEAVDPAELREKADSLSEDELLGSYSLAATPDEFVSVYKPLVTELQADIIVFQTTSLNQEETIKMIGQSVIPQLKSAYA